VLGSSGTVNHSVGVEIELSPPPDTNVNGALLLHSSSYVHRYHTQNYCDVHQAVFRYTKKQHTVSATGFIPVFRKNVGKVISLAPQNYSQGLEVPCEVCITPEFRYSNYSSKDAAACRLVNSYGRFEGQWCLHLRNLALLASEDEGTAVLRW
jgi:hypothetical protein